MVRIASCGTMVCVLLAACLPVTSKAPVGATVGFQMDPLLLGSWTATATSRKSAASVRFLADADGSMTATLVIHDTEWSEYRLRVAHLGANHFINAQEVSNNGEGAHGPLAEDHVLLLYRATADGGIAIYQMDEEATAGAIRGGKIAGEIEPGKDGDLRIIANQPALDAFMRSAGAARLFSKKLLSLVRTR